VFQRRSIVLSAAAGLLAALFPLSLCAQEKLEDQRKRWKELTARFDSLDGQGRFAERVAAAQDALKFAQNAFGPEQRDTALSHFNLGIACAERGAYEDAMRSYQQALAILEKLRGREHTEVLMVLANIAGLHLAQGRFIEAESIYQRCLRYAEKNWGPQHPVTAALLIEMDPLYELQGRYEEAEAGLRRAVAIIDAWQAPRHVDGGVALITLSRFFLRQGRFEEAEALSRRALNIIRMQAKAAKISNPLVLVVANAVLGVAANARGSYAEAEAQLRPVIAPAEQVFGAESPSLANILLELAAALAGQNKDDEAQALYLRALAIFEKQNGPQHPAVGLVVERLAALAYSRGRLEEADRYFDRRTEDLARQFQYHFTYMSERERLGFLDTMTNSFPLYFSFCYSNRGRDPALIGKMYDVLLWQKGFVANSVAAIRSQIAARGDAEALALLDQLQARQAELARLITAPPRDSQEAQRLIGQLGKEANELERSLARRSTMLAEEKRLQQVSWRDVQKALKPGEAAVEFARFRFHDGKRLADQAHYVALILTPETTASPILVELGDAATLEGPVLDRYRAAVEQRSAAEPAVPPAAEFWQPLAPTLGSKHRIYLSPDGVLNLISLALVPGSDGEPLLQTHDLRVLTSTKDLLRSQASGAADSAVLIGNPRFDLTEDQQRAAVTKLGREQPAPVLVAQAAPSSALRGSREGALNSLPGTAAELASVRQLLEQQHWRVQSYLEDAALEEAVKRVHRPRLLHLATHGFFLSDQMRAPHGPAVEVPIGLENPMLRSGLFFAGAERALEGRATAAGMDDGVLTAYEAAALDLQGTELVALSACKTGLGQVRSGEGVFGLRRAFQIAGARAVLMSLWAVPDRETQELMNVFYEKWLGGAEKHDALRKAQLEMRRRVRERYGADLPYYWGAFILVGQ